MGSGSTTRFPRNFFAEIMLGNVFRQLATEALRVSRNQTVSCIVERLLTEASAEHVLMLLNAFAADWEVACTDRQRVSFQF